MASRMNVPRLALVAGLAVLLSGCYAHGGGRYTAHYGASYAYGSGGGGHYATSGHAYHRSGRHGSGRHRYHYRGW